MAEQENVQDEKRKGLERTPDKAPSHGLLSWLMAAAIVAVLTVAGFLVGRLFGTRGPAQTAAAAEQAGVTEPVRPPEAGAESKSGQSWYYDLEPAVANLNEPGVTRYVRVALTLDVDGALAEKEGKVFLDQKKPLLKHWLTLYLANQTVDAIRGEKNLLRMQAQISDIFNRGLFPDRKPRIRRILFKEFAIQ
jgi:flagellar basal body-associated protein FliL